LSVTGTGTLADPLLFDTIIDPDLPDALNALVCGPDGLLARVGQTHAFNLIFAPPFGPAPPGPPGPNYYSSGLSTVSITNDGTTPMDVFALAYLQSTVFSQGSCQPDIKHEIDFGFGLFPANQVLQGFSAGPVALDPVFGGDGSISPFGTNELHGSENSFNVLPISTILGSPLAPAASFSVDHQMTQSYIGAWNASSVVITFAAFILMGVSRA
jgi:hypothetical protein